MFHKTNGTNGKVVPQGFILAQKNQFFILDPLKIKENPNFGGFFIDYSNMCTIFLANATCKSSMSFLMLDYCLTKFQGKKIDFSLEVHEPDISQMDLLSTMRQCE